MFKKKIKRIYTKNGRKEDLRQMWTFMPLYRGRP